MTDYEGEYFIGDDILLQEERFMKKGILQNDDEKQQLRRDSESFV